MSTTTTPTITDEQINHLANESAEGGDLLQLAICERALDIFEARRWTDHRGPQRQGDPMHPPITIKIQGDRTRTIPERFGSDAVEVRHDIEGTSIRHVVVYRSGHEHEFSFLDLLARGDVPCSGEGEVCR